MSGGRMQCKHIPDEVVLRAIRLTPGYWRMHDSHPSGHDHEGWIGVYDALCREMSLTIPRQLYMAKIDKMQRAGKIHACSHYPSGWCRGDIHLPEECKGC